MKLNRWITTLGHVCTIDKVQGAHKDLPYVGMEHIESNTGRFLGSYDPCTVKSSTFKFSPEHLLYGRLRPYLNKVFAPTFTGHCSTEIFPLMPSAGLSREFLQYWLLSDSVVQRINATSTGARMPRANMNQVLGFELPVPPLPEQQRIVQILDEAFKAIAIAKANAEKNLQNSKALFESHLQSVFSQRGEGWEERKLGDICESLHQGLNTAGMKVKFYESGYPIIQTRNIENGVVDLDHKIKWMSKEDWLLYRDKYRPQVGDVFFTNIGTIGKTAVVEADRDYLIHWNIFKLRPRADLVSSAFLKATLDWLTISGYFSSLQKGGTVDFVTKKMIAEAAIGVPNAEAQALVVKTLGAFRHAVATLEAVCTNKMVALDALKRSLLHEAFEGNLTSDTDGKVKSIEKQAALSL